MRIVILGMCLLAIGLAQGCGKTQEDVSDTKAEGVLGTSCTSQPVLRDSSNLNVCKWPQSNWPGHGSGEFFYAGLNGLTAKAQAIRSCIDANGLDYGYMAGPGKSCAKECERVTSCLPFTNQ